MGRPHRWKAIASLRTNSSGAVGHHQDVAWLSFTVAAFRFNFRRWFNGNKKPCFHFGKQGGNFVKVPLPACLHRTQIDFELCSSIANGAFDGKRIASAIPAMARPEIFRDRHHRSIRSRYVVPILHRTYETITTSPRLQATYTFGGSAIMNSNIRIA